MKKILILITILFASILLVSCKNDKVKIEWFSSTVANESIEVNLKVDDPSSSLRISSLLLIARLDGSTYEAARDEDAVFIKETETHLLKVTGLLKDTSYSVEVWGTLENSNESKKLDSKVFTTTNKGQNSTTPISITTVDEFKAISDNSDSYFILENDIDFGGEILQGESFFSSNQSAKAFKGHLNGNNFAVKNIVLSTATKPIYHGLFGYIQADSTNSIYNIKDLTLDNITVVDTTYISTTHVGILAGRVSANSIIENVVVKNSSLVGRFDGNSKTPSNVGGVIGYCEGLVTNLVTQNVTLSINLFGTNSMNIGGVIGYTVSSSLPHVTNKLGSDTSIVFNSLVTSIQPFSMTINIAGVVGKYSNQETLTNIYNTGDITVKNFNFVNAEGTKNDKAVNNDDTLRVAGLVGEYNAAYPLNNGLSYGKVTVNSIDQFSRIEHVLVSGLVATVPSNSTTYSNIYRIGSYGIDVTTNASKRVLNSDVDAISAASNTQNVGLLVSSLEEAILPSTFFENLNSEVHGYIRNSKVLGNSISFDVKVNDLNNTVTSNTVSVVVSASEYNLEISSALSDHIVLVNLELDTEYTISLVSNGVVLSSKVIKTGVVSFNIVSSTTTYDSYEATIEIIDTESKITAASVKASLFEGNASKNTNNNVVDKLSYKTLKGGTTYEVVVSATVSGKENTEIYRYSFTTLTASVTVSEENTSVTKSSITLEVQESLLYDSGLLYVEVHTNETRIELNKDAVTAEVTLSSTPNESGETLVETLTSGKNQTAIKNNESFEIGNLAENTVYRVSVYSYFRGETKKDPVVKILLYQFEIKTVDVVVSIDNQVVTEHDYDAVVNIIGYDSLGNEVAISEDEIKGLKVKIYHNNLEIKELSPFVLTGLSTNISYSGLDDNEVFVLKVYGILNGKEVELSTSTFYFRTLK
ncbi:MAG: hypothetical protein LBV51_00520 [Acholeplasmatales bacterium]|jgi:hypothetical protein|nr:hypothetical protein [Acholeplasmatales bacterium]